MNATSSMQNNFGWNITENKALYVFLITVIAFNMGTTFYLTICITLHTDHFTWWQFVEPETTSVAYININNE